MAALAALGVDTDRDTALAADFRTLSMNSSPLKALMVRRGYKRAIAATAHKLLRVLYVVLRDARPYHDPEADYEALMVRRNAPRWIRMLHRYGLIGYEPATAA